MGGGGATKTIVRKTESDVKKDLFKQASANARKLLKEKTGQDLPENTDLDDVMLPLAKWRFKEEFSIPWEQDPLMYKDKNLPGAQIETIVSISQLCNVDANSDIDGFVDTVLLSKVDLPKWMAGNAKASLKTLAKKLTSQDTQLQTRYNAYEMSFDGEKETDDSWHAKAVNVFLKGSLLEDSIKADVTIIYFLAIYYKTDSPTRTTRTSINNNAFSTAKAYMKSSNTISNLSDLEKALRPYSEQAFKDHFKFAYDTTTPPRYDPNASASLRVNNAFLFYFQDLQQDDLDSQVETRLFQGLSIPERYSEIKKQAENDVVKHFKGVLSDIKAGVWADSFLSQEYSIEDPKVNPIQMNVIFVKFFGQQSTKDNVAISCTYIYPLVIIWEMLTADAIVTGDIYKLMIKNLRQHLQHNDGANDILDMEKSLDTFAKERFKDSFRFGYDDPHAPDSTMRPARLPGVRACAAFPSPVPQDKLTAWFDQHLFKRTGDRMFGYARGQIYDDMNGDLKYHLNNISSQNMWDDEGSERTYQHPMGSAEGKPIRVNTIYTFGRGGMSENGVYKEMVFLYVLMHARAVTDGSGDDEW